jgi:hypothetical protein
MSRPLTEGEERLARSVFGGAIDYARVRISTRTWGWAAICFWSHVTFPPGAPAPRDFAWQGKRMQAWLIHELTHVWQFQTRPFWTLWSWFAVLVGGGYGPGLPGYRYRAPLKAWGAYNLEQQASIIEHAFLLREIGRCEEAPVSLTELCAVAPFDLQRPSSSGRA